MNVAVQYVEFGMVLPSGANTREHWSKRAKRAATHRKRAFIECAGVVWFHSGTVTVTFTRQAPRALDDDNLAYAFKSIRDGVADALGVPDNDPRITWRYAQAKGPAKVSINIEARA